MARARNIKPGFYKNEDLAECSIWARFIFPGLWMLADREGRLEDRPKRIKGELLPFDSQDVEPLLHELQARGFIDRYEVDGKAFIQIVAFSKHQNPHHREPESSIPPPQSPGLSARATTPKPEVSQPSDTTETRGKPEASPRQDPPKSDLARGVNRADSLIPDSGFPIPEKTLLSGKPDPAKSEARKKLSEECAEVLAFLNEKTGRNYQPVKANIQLIAARLREGATVVQLRQVIAKKCREWRDDPQQEIYLRPKTLFNATNFANYQGELVA